MRDQADHTFPESKEEKNQDPPEEEGGSSMIQCPPCPPPAPAGQGAKPPKKTQKSKKKWDFSGVAKYYGYRYYHPQTGRWINRDPLIEEAFFTNYKVGMKKREEKRLREESFMPAYLFTRNNPVNNLDRIGLDVIVIIGCPFKESNNVFGHAAISVTGHGTYSWGTHHIDGTPLNDYLAEETKLRRQCLYWIETTPEEDKAMIAAFLAERKKGYSVIKQQTCSTAASAAMVEIGVFKNVTASPIMLMRWFELGLSRRQGVKGACFCKNEKGLPFAYLNGFTNTQKSPAANEK